MAASTSLCQVRVTGPSDSLEKNWYALPSTSRTR